MSIKAILYIFTLPLIIWSLDSLKIDGVFKKNRYYQANILYIIISIALSYLVVNFFWDVFLNTKFI